MRHLDRALVVAATVIALCAAAAFGAQLHGYSHQMHPLALPGAVGVPRAPAYNMLVFVLPGLLLAVYAWRLRGRLPQRTGVAARLGTTMLLLSALAYAAQGGLPLDLDGLDAGASRLHAAAWNLWWIAFLAGTVLMATGLRALRLEALGAWLLVLGAGVLVPELPGAGISQRLAFAAWFAWMWRVEAGTRAR